MFGEQKPKKLYHGLRLPNQDLKSLFEHFWCFLLSSSCHRCMSLASRLGLEKVESPFDLLYLRRLREYGMKSSVDKGYKKNQAIVDRTTLDEVIF